MKKYLFIILSLISQIAFSREPITQFATIQDKDGYVLVRDSSSVKSKAIDTLRENDIFYWGNLEGRTKSNWIGVNYYMGKFERYGFVHNSRVKLLYNFERLKRNSKKSNLEFILKDSTIQVNIEVDTFYKKDYKILYKKSEDGYKFIDKINGKFYYGCDGGIPSQRYKSLEIIWNRKNIIIPKVAFDDLFEPNFDLTFATYDSKTNRLFIFADNSDAAGSYSVVWIFKNGKYLKRLVQHSCC